MLYVLELYVHGPGYTFSIAFCQQWDCIDKQQLILVLRVCALFSHLSSPLNTVCRRMVGLEAVQNYLGASREGKNLYVEMGGIQQ